MKGAETVRLILSGVEALMTHQPITAELRNNFITKLTSYLSNNDFCSHDL